MNTFHTASKACALRGMPFRSVSIRTLQPSQSRHLSTATTQQAQPIDLTSSEISTPKSKSSTLPSSILTRAPTDSTSNPSIKLSTPELDPSKHLSPFSPTLYLGTITRTGTMARTIQITRNAQIYDKFLQKHYTRPVRVLAHDPNPSGFLREGDVIEYGHWSSAENDRLNREVDEKNKRLIEEGKIKLFTRRGKRRDIKVIGRTRNTVKFVVRKLVSPFAVGVEGREKEREVAEKVREEAVEVKRVEKEAQGKRKGKRRAVA